MPIAPLWSVFFFIMMLTLGFGSQFSIIECVLSAFTDEFPALLSPRKNNIIFRIAACAVMFLLGLAMVSQVYTCTIVHIIMLIYLHNIVQYFGSEPVFYQTSSTGSINAVIFAICRIRVVLDCMHETITKVFNASLAMLPL